MCVCVDILFVFFFLCFPIFVLFPFLCKDRIVCALKTRNEVKRVNDLRWQKKPLLKRRRLESYVSPNHTSEDTSHCAAPRKLFILSAHDCGVLATFSCGCAELQERRLTLKRSNSRFPELVFDGHGTLLWIGDDE